MKHPHVFCCREAFLSREIFLFGKPIAAPPLLSFDEIQTPENLLSSFFFPSRGGGGGRGGGNGEIRKMEVGGGVGSNLEKVRAFAGS